MTEKDQVVEILRKAMSPPFKATMGDGAGNVVVDGRPGYIWCRKLGRSEMLMQAYNRGAQAIEGIVILVQESRVEHMGYEVVGYAGGASPDDVYPPVPPHAWTHEWRPGIGRDRVTVYPRSWGYLRAEPVATGSMNVWVTPGWYYYNGEYHWYAGGYSPAFGAPVGSTWYQTLYMDPSNETLHIVDGVTGGYGYTIPPAPPDCMLGIAAVESTGTFDAVTENMIEDIRLFMDSIAECGDLIQHGHSGTASGGLLDHGLAHIPASLLDDDHTQYLKERLSGGLAIEIPLHNHDNVLVSLANQTGGQRTVNDVVITHPSIDNSFTGTAVEAYAGKILVVAETIDNLATGTLWERGGPFDIAAEGAITWNDGLRTSGTPFLAEAAPFPTGTGVFAIALSAKGGGIGTISALFLDEVAAPGGDGDGNGAATTIEIQEDDVKVVDADTVNFEGGGGKVTDEGGGKVTVDITGDHYETKLIHWFHQTGGVEGNVGNIGVLSLGNNDQAFFNFHLPSDFDEIVTSVIIILPDATEQVQWDERTSYGATGEAWGLPSETLDNLTKNVTVNQFAELDVSGVLTGVTAGDHIGLSIISNTDTLRVMGLLLRYKTT